MANELYQGIGTELQGKGFLVEEKEADKKRQLQTLEDTGLYVAEPKLDGIWFSADIGEGGTAEDVVIRSREGKTKDVEPLRKVLAKCFPSRTTLIGELGYGSQTAVEKKERIGHDFCDLFDITCYAGESLLNDRRADRRETLRNAHFAAMHEAANRGLDELWFSLTEQWVDNFVQHYEDEAEGIVLKRKDNGAYVGGGKLKEWIKVKKQYTDDFVVMGWVKSVSETKKDRNMVAAIICGAYVNCTQYQAWKKYEGWLKTLEIQTLEPPRTLQSDYRLILVPLVKCGAIPHELSLDMAEHFEEKYLGRTVEISHFMKFKSGSVRHPGFVRFRDDKLSRECIEENVEL